MLAVTESEEILIILAKDAVFDQSLRNLGTHRQLDLGFSVVVVRWRSTSNRGGRLNAAGHHKRQRNWLVATKGKSVAIGAALLLPEPRKLGILGVSATDGFAIGRARVSIRRRGSNSRRLSCSGKLRVSPPLKTRQLRAGIGFKRLASLPTKG